MCVKETPIEVQFFAWALQRQIRRFKCSDVISNPMAKDFQYVWLSLDYTYTSLQWKMTESLMGNCALKMVASNKLTPNRPRLFTQPRKQWLLRVILLWYSVCWLLASPLTPYTPRAPGYRSKLWDTRYSQLLSRQFWPVLTYFYRLWQLHLSGSAASFWLDRWGRHK